MRKLITVLIGILITATSFADEMPAQSSVATKPEAKGATVECDLDEQALKTGKIRIRITVDGIQEAAHFGVNGINATCEFDDEEVKRP